MLDMLDHKNVGQIKLHQLAVFNWGSFNGLHIAHIDEKGTLITGDNGSGKSTLIDALMALLMPAGKASFNIAAAQNDKSDRSLMSYIRGSFGSSNDGSRMHSKNKRDKATLTGLQAIYKTNHDDYISLMALFWINGSSLDNMDIQRLYMVIHQKLSLKIVIDEFDKNKQGFKKWLEKNHIHYTDKFSEYHALYSRSLHLKNNAPALLTRALGLKKVDDLTDLIRTLVLEPSHHIKEKAKEIVKEFSDLRNTYEKLVDIKEQLAHLERLPQLSENIDHLIVNITHLEDLQECLPIYLAKIEYKTLLEQKHEIEKQYIQIQTDIAQKEQQLALCRETIEQYQLEYHQLGGDKIQHLEQEIKYLDKELSRLNHQASYYQHICRELGLNDELNQHIFQHNQQVYFEQKQKISNDLEQQQQKFHHTYFEYQTFQNKMNELLQEIKTIEQAKSNIAAPFQTVRMQLCQALNLSDDDIPYMGELLDVKDEEKAWQGAIERALGGLINTLLVSQNHYKPVTEWLNQTHTGLHIRVQVVKEHIHQKTMLEHGFVDKLKFKSHIFSEWLKQFLSHYDLICVDNVNQAQMTPFSMTIEGLIQKEKGRFEKNDKKAINDRKYWQLGFSNQTRLALLKNELKQYQQDEQTLALALKEIKVLSEQLQNIIQQWDRLHLIVWENIDVMSTKRQKDEKQNVLNQLLQASNHLEKIQQLLQDERQNEKKYQNQCSNLIGERGKISQRQQDIEHKIKRIQTLAEQNIHQENYVQLEKYYEQFAHLNHIEEIKNKCQSVLNRELDNEKAKKVTCENQIRGIIISFNSKEKWRYLTQDWRNDLSGLADYLAYYQQLKEEKLADFEKKFQDRLTKHSSESLLNFTQSIKDTHEDIKHKIEAINQVLQKTEFRQNSYLRLKAKMDKYPYNIEFDKLIKEVAVAHVQRENADKRYQLLGKVVEILEKVTHPATANNQESLRLLEPRYQLSFTAEELHIDGRLLDELNSSSGKSGGEKESFAGMIMAASLAYVLTPDDSDKPVYCTVFLDEAFSNTQESVSRRVLKVFKDLHIHINLITPYKNLNLAKETAGSLIICEKNSATHESRLCEITWQQLDEHLNKNIQTELAHYGIEVQENPQ